MDDKRTPGRETDPESVCRYFQRIPLSLIEEPEVCEWCEYFENGLCFKSVE